MRTDFGVSWPLGTRNMVIYISWWRKWSTSAIHYSEQSALEPWETVLTLCERDEQMVHIVTTVEKHNLSMSPQLFLWRCVISVADCRRIGTASAVDCLRVFWPVPSQNCSIPWIPLVETGLLQF